MERGSVLPYFILILVMLIFALAGCGPREASSETPQVAGSDTTSTTDEPPLPVSSTDSVPAAEKEAASEESSPPESKEILPTAKTVPDDLISRSIESLQALSSYRYSALVRFEWTDEERVQSYSIEIAGEFVFPNREHVTWTNSSFGERLEVVRIYDSAWLLEYGEWTEIPTLTVEGLMSAVILFAPSYAWESLANELETTSILVGKEVVNGFSTLHYTSDYSGWEERFDGALHTGKGEFWVAEEGFPVRCIFTGTGNDKDGHLGAIEWRMEITDVNHSISIEPPGT